MRVVEMGPHAHMRAAMEFTKTVICPACGRPNGWAVLADGQYRNLLYTPHAAQLRADGTIRCVAEIRWWHNACRPSAESYDIEGHGLDEEVRSMTGRGLTPWDIRGKRDPKPWKPWPVMWNAWAKQQRDYWPKWEKAPLAATVPRE